MRTFVAAALTCLTLTLGACGGDEPSAAPDTGAGPTAAPAAEPEAAPAAEAPGDEICVVKQAWDKADGFLVKANREKPPAPSYGLAAQFLEGTIPPSSIETQWKELKDRTRAYAEVLSFGTPDEIAAQADEVGEISRRQLALYGIFRQNCP